MSRDTHRQHWNEQHMLRAAERGKRSNNFFRAVLGLAALIPAESCNNDAPRDSRDISNPEMASSTMEKNFPERYNLDIRLPMDAHSFLQIVQRLGLRYQVCGRNDDDIGMPSSHHVPPIDLSRAQVCYEIFGRVYSSGVAESWRAFEDERHQIFHIEPVYAYPGL